MATLESVMKLNDMMSAPIRHIADAMGMMLSKWEELDSSTSGGLNIGDTDAIRAKLQRATQALGEMEDEQEQFRKKVKESSNEVSGLASKIATAVGAFIGLNAIKNTLSSAIQYSSDLSESQNVVDVSFGESAQQINDWSQNTLNAFGLNELSAKRFAGTMGAMLKSSGLAGDEVTEMSMRITELAGDMASFYNLDGQEAFDKLRAGISGETEPLKALGVNMSVANLEAFALSQGVNKAYNEMSQAEQVTLRYAYLMQATADAQGDFARTSNSFANQQKLLKENWKAFTGELVSKSLPALAAGMNILNNGITWLSENWSILQPILLGIATAVGLYTTALVINKAVQMASAFATTIKTIASVAHGAAITQEMLATTGMTKAQLAFNASLFSCPITWIVIAVIALIAALFALCAWLAKTQGAANSAFGVMAGGINVVIQFFKNLGITVANIALGIWNALGAVCDNIGIGFRNAIKGVQSWFYNLLSTALTVVEGICKALNKLPFVEFDYSGISSKAEEYASKAAEAAGSKEEYVSVADAFNEGFETFEAFGEGWVQDAYDAGASWGDGVSEGISEFFGGLTGGMDALSDSMGGSGTWEDGMVSDGASGWSTSDPAYNLLDKIGSDTGSMKKSLDITSEDLKYMRDLAEQGVINRFTTAEIHVNMGGITNTVNKNTDVDGVIDYMVTGIQEAMERTAEGVHN